MRQKTRHFKLQRLNFEMKNNCWGRGKTVELKNIQDVKTLLSNTTMRLNWYMDKREGLIVKFQHDSLQYGLQKC